MERACQPGAFASTPFIHPWRNSPTEPTQPPYSHRQQGHGSPGAQAPPQATPWRGGEERK